MFNKGTKMYWKKDGKPAYEKQEGNDFGLWLSLDEKQLKLPVEKRFGFKWDDQGVYDYYNGIMTFQLTN